MIGRRGADLRGEFRTATAGELVRVQLRDESVRLPREQDPARLRDRERPLLHEHIAELRQGPCAHLWDQLPRHELDVVGATVLELGRDHVGGEERRDDALGAGLPELPIQLEQRELVLQGEAVTGLGLNGGDTEPRHTGEMALAAPPEFLPGGGAGLRHRGPDAPAPGRDLEVALAPDPGLELIGAPAAEREVGVAVHEPGDHEPAPGGVAFLAGEHRGEFRRRPHPGDPVPLPGNRGIPHQVEVPRPAGHPPGHQRGDVEKNRH